MAASSSSNSPPPHLPSPSAAAAPATAATFAYNGGICRLQHIHVIVIVIVIGYVVIDVTCDAFFEQLCANVESRAKCTACYSCLLIIEPIDSIKNAYYRL